MRATDLFGGPFTPVGFYYKTFIRPRRWWPLYERFLRSAAGLGVLPREQDEREWRTEYRRRHADVMVVGGGAAGLSAAIAAARAGADVVLADEGLEPGGRLLAEGGHERAAALTAEAEAAGVEVLRARQRARLLRRPRAGVAGRDAAPGPRAGARLRDRRDRAAARVRQQRPARDHALGRRPRPGRAVRRRSRASAPWW